VVLLVARLLKLLTEFLVLEIIPLITLAICALAAFKDCTALAPKLLPKISPICIMTLDGDAIPTSCLMASIEELPNLVNNPMTLPAEENTPLPNAEIKLMPISLRFPPLLKMFIALLMKLLSVLIIVPRDENTPLPKEEIKLTPTSFSPPPLPNADMALLNTLPKMLSPPKSFLTADNNLVNGWAGFSTSFKYS